MGACGPLHFANLDPYHARSDFAFDQPGDSSLIITNSTIATRIEDATDNGRYRPRYSDVGGYILFIPGVPTHPGDHVRDMI